MNRRVDGVELIILDRYVGAEIWIVSQMNNTGPQAPRKLGPPISAPPLQVAIEFTRDSSNDDRRSACLKHNFILGSTIGTMSFYHTATSSDGVSPQQAANNVKNLEKETIIKKVSIQYSTSYAKK